LALTEEPFDLEAFVADLEAFVADLDASWQLEAFELASDQPLVGQKQVEEASALS
jgi:hypothetical protein